MDGQILLNIQVLSRKTIRPIHTIGFFNISDVLKILDTLDCKRVNLYSLDRLPIAIHIDGKLLYVVNIFICSLPRYVLVPNDTVAILVEQVEALPEELWINHFSKWIDTSY